MDALMAALVLGALCQAGDRTPWLAAILADRFRTPGVVVFAATVALATNYAIGVAGGLLIRPLLTPEARLLLLAMALILAGLGMPWRMRAPDRLSGWTLGAWGTSIAGLAIMVLGDRMQFIAAALSMRRPLPWLSAVGATLGALAVTVPAILIGEAGWTALPHRAIRIGTSAILMVAGVVIGVNGLRLV